MIHATRRGASIWVLVSLVVLQIGCGKEQQQAAAPAPAPVTVSKPAREDVSDFVEFTGTTAAVASVDVRARVKGFLKKRHFADGAIVKEGDLLFEIEPDIFEAAVDGAKAALQAGEARLQKSKADLGIKQEMAAGNAASKLDVIQAEANVATASAEVSSATAALKQANIDLSYTKIYAPLSGKIDRTRVDVGNLVGSDGNTLLANIVQADPIYVYFGVDEPTVQRFMARMQEHGVKADSNEKPTMPMSMSIGGSNDFKYAGVIDYVENKVDASTGTIKVRGILKNPDFELIPGFFTRVRVPDGDSYNAILVPERAIGVDQGQKYVLVVNSKNVVESRPIEAGSAHGRMRVVKQGVTADEWVITEGILRTRPGATVSPQQKSASPPPATAPSAAGDQSAKAKS